MTDSLDAARIAGLMAGLLDGPSPASGARPAIVVVAETASTNADLRERAGTLQSPLLLAAERQTAGRGRAGRSWLAEPGDSLCFSLAWPFKGPLHRLSGLSLAVGVALAEALRAPPMPANDGSHHASTPVMLKWPNDLLVDGAKLGGILIETVGAAARDGMWAVIGVGLNVRANPVRDGAIDQPVAALYPARDGSEPDIGIDRNALLAQLAASLTVALDSFERDGLAPFIVRWEALHAHAGQPVSIVEQGRTLHQGRALGIDASGCLQLDSGSGIVKIAAGDVSLRAFADSPDASKLDASRPDASARSHALH
jgi:BirA family biotin operon repressor/biotin-[acetyl-CoA-carboxylase] ligase